MEARSTQRGDVRDPSAGFGHVGACWGPRTSPAVLMLGPPDRGGLDPQSVCAEVGQDRGIPKGLRRGVVG